MTRSAATLIGFSAVLMWSVLALMSAASGNVPPFQLAATTFFIGGMIGVAAWPFRPHALAALRQDWRVWLLGIAGLFGYHFVYFPAIRAAPPVGAAFYTWDHGVKRGDIMILGAASYAAPLLSTLVLVLTGFAAFHRSVAAACLLITAGAVVAAKDMLFGRKPKVI